jgi:YesN/AraC family two-component response regulator
VSFYCSLMAGYKNISEAADGREGLAQYFENPTDLVITDMVMPEKLGIDTILEIIEHFPKAKILAMSGGGFFGPEIELDMADKLGVRTFTKPIEQKQLLSAIRDLLDSP